MGEGTQVSPPMGDDFTLVEVVMGGEVVMVYCIHWDLGIARAGRYPGDGEWERVF